MSEREREHDFDSTQFSPFSFAGRSKESLINMSCFHVVLFMVCRLKEMTRKVMEKKNMKQKSVWLSIYFEKYVMSFLKVLIGV